MKSSILLLIILFFTAFQASAQVPDSVYHNRLYITCKAWGHVKYYHSNVANGTIFWDDLLLNALNDIKNAPDNAAFNNALLSMINGAGVTISSQNVLPTIPDSLNNNKNYSWINDPILSNSVSSALDTIRNKFRPQNNAFVSENYPGSQPIFTNDDLYYSDTDYPDEGKRVLALFRYWNIIHYFFPYKHIMDQNWDTTLIEFIPQIISSTDALSYHLAFKKFTAKINDSHSFYYSPTYSNWVGRSSPPFLTRFIENEMVITKVLPMTPNIKVGDIIKKIDGKNIYHLRDSLRPLAHGSNNVIIERELNNIISRGAIGSFTVTVDDGNSIHTESLNRTNSNFNDLIYNPNPAWRDTTISGGCNIGIVDMGKLEANEVHKMFHLLRNTDAIIFDIRNYPKGTLWEIVNYLYPTPIQVADFTRPDILHPGRLVWDPDIIGYGTSTPYTGNIAILFDERTQSQAEYTIMGLEQFPRAIKIGSTTSGADGNISKIYLPGKILTYATFLGTYYPNHTPTQRIGIIPDYEVHPTILGIRAQKDEVLDYALNCTLVGINDIQPHRKFSLYPNPANDNIKFEHPTQIVNTIEIYNIQGQKIKIIKPLSHTGIIDISELNSGLYFLTILSENGTSTQIFTKQ